MYLLTLQFLWMINIIIMSQYFTSTDRSVIAFLSLTTAWLWGGPSRPQPRGVLHFQAERRLPRPSFCRGRGGLWQWWVRWGLQDGRERIPLARAERAVPQEEKEETLSQVQETKLLTRGEWNATMDTNKLYIWVIVLFFYLVVCGAVTVSVIYLWLAIISQCCHRMAARHTGTIYPCRLQLLLLNYVVSAIIVWTSAKCNIVSNKEKKKEIRPIGAVERLQTD